MEQDLLLIAVTQAIEFMQLKVDGPGHHAKKKKHVKTRDSNIGVLLLINLHIIKNLYK